DAGTAIRRGLAEQRVGLCAGGGVELGRRIDSRPLRVIEGIVELAAKLKTGPLADHNVFEHREIPLVLPRTAEHVPAGASDVAQRRKREDALIKPLGAVSRAPREVGVGRDIDSLSVAAADKVNTGGSGKAHALRCTAGEGNGARYIPIP